VPGSTISAGIEDLIGHHAVERAAERPQIQQARLLPPFDPRKLPVLTRELKFRLGQFEFDLDLSCSWADMNLSACISRRRSNLRLENSTFCSAAITGRSFRPVTRQIGRRTLRPRLQAGDHLPFATGLLAGHAPYRAAPRQDCGSPPTAPARSNLGVWLRPGPVKKRKCRQGSAASNHFRKAHRMASIHERLPNTTFNGFIIAVTWRDLANQQ